MANALRELKEKPGTTLWGELGITRQQAENSDACAKDHRYNRPLNIPLYRKTYIDDQELAACTLYLTSRRTYGIPPIAQTLHMAVFARLSGAEFRQNIPLPTLFAYARLTMWREQLRRAQNPLPLPLSSPIDAELRLISGSLFLPDLPTSWGWRLAETALPN
ncbi:MAG: hypothetical protein EOP50_18540, partial [Sphingobacteriales bacterium]